MLNIYDLSYYQLYILKSIDPILDKDWHKKLLSVFTKLDQPSQNVVYKKILQPRRIFYNKEKKCFQNKNHISLKDALLISPTSNRSLLKCVEHMQDFLKLSGQLATEKVADKIEALLSHLDQVDINLDLDEHKVREQLRQAFLYDVSIWIDTIDLIIPKNVRALTSEVIKTFLKEVFIKHQIYGNDFRSWNALEIDDLELSHFPTYLSKPSKDRQLQIVETAEYWFLIGQPNKFKDNTFSLRRFLFEDNGFQFVYLSGLVVSRHSFNDAKVKKSALQQISSIYSLDRTLSEDIVRFIKDCKTFQKKYLRPILRKPLSRGITDIEEMIAERLAVYEKNLTSLVLDKLPRVINAISSMDDEDYLYYHMNALFKDFLEDVENFRLLPVVQYSKSAQLMSVKILCIMQMMNNFKEIEKSPEEKDNIIKQPLLELGQLYDETETEMTELEKIKKSIFRYEEKKQEKKLLSRFTNKAPTFTLDDVANHEKKLNETFFISIVRLAKKRRNIIIYPEYECRYTEDDNFRHYAFPYGKNGLGKLPRIVRLPENREIFYYEQLEQSLGAGFDFDEVV